MNILAFLMAQAPAAAANGEQPNMLMSLLPIVLIFVVFYFFLIRPEKKKSKQISDMRDNLRVGDEIVTIGGIIGRITNIKDDQITLETGSDKNKIRMLRSAVGQKLEKEEPVAELNGSEEE